MYGEKSIDQEMLVTTRDFRPLRWKPREVRERSEAGGQTSHFITLGGKIAEKLFKKDGQCGDRVDTAAAQNPRHQLRVTVFHTPWHAALELRRPERRHSSAMT